MAKLNDLSKLKANADLATTVLDRRYSEPFISNRNRLEGIPREAEFDKSLRAETADPLWMLTRQWQMGEFQGEDAGTACTAKVLVEEQSPGVISYANQTTKSYDPYSSPLEPNVESEPIEVNLYLKVQMGRQFLRILAEHGKSAFKSQFFEKYPISVTISEHDKEGQLFWKTVKGKFPDGHRLLTDIKSGLFGDWVLTSDLFSDLEEKELMIKKVGQQFETWYEKLYFQQGNDQNAWIPERMEYNFKMEMPHHEGGKGIALEAEQYASGRLDWDSFDESEIALNKLTPQPDNKSAYLKTFIPSPLQFTGLPNPRFWQMEEGKVDFGKIQSGTTGLLSMLVTEYAITYSNDWFVLPLPMKINTYSEVKNILVTDVFGEHILIEPTHSQPEMSWNKFEMFRHALKSDSNSGQNRFYLAPTLLKIQESKALEKINFMRDEMSNMVWAIENTIPSQASGGREIKLIKPRIEPLGTPENPESKIRYLAGTAVPDNWVPFIPVHKPENKDEIRLQRAKIPNASKPNSLLLREQQPVHFIEEEEIPRAGVIVKRNFKRTRWLGGKTILWVGRTKTSGRGEGWSGLMFDRILHIESGK